MVALSWQSPFPVVCYVSWQQAFYSFLFHSLVLPLQNNVLYVQPAGRALSPLKHIAHGAIV
jgi:hypothetical protein